MFAKVQQPGAPETEAAISAAHGAYKAWAATPVSAREAIFFRAADVRGALPLADKSGSFLKRHFLEYFAPTSEAATGTMAFGIWNGG